MIKRQIVKIEDSFKEQGSVYIHFNKGKGLIRKLYKRATFSYRSITMVQKLEGKLAIKEILMIAVLKGMDKDTINTFSFYNKSTKYHDALLQIQKA